MNKMQEDLESRYAFRDHVVRRLAVDLEGPAAEDETLTERPLERYVTGILWPASESSRASVIDDPDSDADTAGEGAADVPVASSRMTAPSSMGMTFTVDPRRCGAVTLTVRAARYVPDGERPSWKEAQKAQADETQEPERKWHRLPVRTTPVVISLAATTGQPERHPIVEGGGLELYVLPRRADASGFVTVTAVIRNLEGVPEREDRDAAAWFQIGISAETSVAAIVDRRNTVDHVPDDPDLKTSALLYRDQHSFGSGHGCAVAWDDAVGGVAERVWTEFVPRVDVARAKPGETEADLTMQTLSSGGADVVLSELSLLCDRYETWIADRRTGVDEGSGTDRVSDELKKIAGSHLDAAQEALSRMRNGIELLRKDSLAFEAFTMANQAMHLQRARQDWIRAGSSGTFELTNQTWRPFQIAFVLINLPSLTNRHSEERAIADLLWFPAGGGKTEAYLALIAYLVVLRRLRDPEVEGTAVIMRYTLRLLTIQQFERAAMLMCSLERLRLETGKLGARAFGIGLWVGSASTPNNLRDARQNLGRLKKNQVVEVGNPMQLRACPWCGARLSADDYVLGKGSEGLRICCSDDSCHFREGLPAYVVDEDVYRVRPELVIGTVDKFARMTWDGQIATLFGRVSDKDIGPDLIIQDELHLISGPLGSTVGLYESAVDLAAGSDVEGDTIIPKIVASTATIRRAQGQISSVFNRESRLFPPPGLNPDESFFAEPSARTELGTRQYVGVMAPGTSHATLMVRVYASLLDTVSGAEDVPDAIRDPYWTLIGYFNSLRVLGSAYLQVSDDVASRLKLLAARRGADNQRRTEPEELTSRRPSSEIPQTLKRLEQGLGGQGAPLDVVLATNMISVGLDVDRLGLMAVMGQPPSSAEYIQATSRVGRKFPGLVVTIFNAAKSRDRSHYEGFTDFHRSLYRAVEATSATPFADRSRDRALHAAYVAALRMTVPSLRDNAAASVFDPADPAVRKVEVALLERAEAVADRRTLAATKKDLASLAQQWFDSARSPDGIQVYQDKKKPERALLIDGAQALCSDGGQGQPSAGLPWATPQSMRDVDAETLLKVQTMTTRPGTVEGN